MRLRQHGRPLMMIFKLFSFAIDREDGVGWLAAMTPRGGGDARS